MSRAESDFQAQVNRLMEVLVEKGYANEMNYPVVERSDGPRVRVCWGRQGLPSVMFQSTSISSFVEMLRNRDYSILLSDRSMLQISAEFERGELVKHRYCYYPCPVLIPEEDEWFVESEGLDGYIGALSLDALMERLRLGGAFRIDFDRSAARSGHPACHFTVFGTTPYAHDNRVPVFAPLSLGHFVSFFFRQYYRGWWVDCKELREFPIVWHDRTLDGSERYEFHVEWYRAETLVR